MKTIYQIISESKKEDNIAYEYLFKTYYKSELNRYQIRKTLDWMKNEMKVCKEFEKYLDSIDSTKTAWTFFANDDAFLDSKQYPSILDRLADYLFTLSK